MKMDLKALVKQAQLLPVIPRGAAEEYSDKQEKLKSFVDEEMTRSGDIDSLIGENNIPVLLDNHSHHVRFMANVFGLNDTGLLGRMLPWVYRSYHARGFSYDYFPRALDTWSGAVEKILSENNRSAILRVYSWMLERHADIIALAVETGEGLKELGPRKEAFLSALIGGDDVSATKLAREIVVSSDALESFYLDIVQPVMYKIGDLWERNEISTVQEHLASAVITRILAVMYPVLFNETPYKEKVIVATPPGEFHEMGARILADLLELDGWNVRYLGMNTPQKELLEYIGEIKPFIVAVSIAMPFNLMNVRALIKGIRECRKPCVPRIMIGGQVFKRFPDLWKSVDADGSADDAARAVMLANQWRDESSR